jgi:phosphoribosylaminoimidazole-succinocarboxamide synthase
MSQHKLLVFISGEGTNLQAIIDAIQSNIIDASIVGVVSNRRNAYGLTRAQEHNIPTYYKPFLANKISRTQYDQELADFVSQIDHDLIVLAGWMHIFSNDFLSNLSRPIINLHPALPGKFAGKDAIGDAFRAFQRGETKKTGIMVHHVIEEIDAGAVIGTIDVPIFANDTEDKLRQRIRYFEKPLLLESINKVLSENDNVMKMDVYHGKVRDIYNIGANLLAISASDRQSAFDRQICVIPNKGKILTEVSAWWFNKTQDIIENHYLYHYNNVMIVKKCKPIKIEMVVRGYMTGSTKTSLWTHYHNNIRQYCGHNLRDGYIKNQKLDYNIVTPTTKGETDELISSEEIVANNILTQDEWNYLETISLKLFEYGQQVADEKGLILVDTKYEFGKDINGNIILIDELHTCDSSRYWMKESYQQRFNEGLEPQRFDKDLIREWIKERCNPYNDNLPEIPPELINNVYNEYSRFMNIIIN